MIPVASQPPPASFDERVRRPGLRWLEEHGIALDAPVEPGTKLHPYWRGCLDELHESYRGICAYLCVFIERCTGGVSTDHFVAKSKNAGLAYEWSNYRLACSTMNARKRDFEDVLDPFSLPPDTFRLVLPTGHIYPNPTLSADSLAAARETISRLGLDDAGCRELRARRFLEYVRTRGALPNPGAEAHLKRYSPFVWIEASRQGLL